MADHHPHPVDPWSLYAHGAADAASYNTAYVHVFKVETCEQWGAVWNHVPMHAIHRPDARVRVRGIAVTSWSFFRDGVLPEWEHPANKRGATLTARVALAPHDASELWKCLMVECVRGAAPDEVLGVQIARKQSRHASFTKVDVWLASDARLHPLREWVVGLTGVHDFQVGRRDAKR